MNDLGKEINFLMQSRYFRIFEKLSIFTRKISQKSFGKKAENPQVLYIKECSNHYRCGTIGEGFEFIH